MRKIKYTVFLLFSLFLLNINLFSQENEKVWFDGLARSYFARDAIDLKNNPDTISSRNSSNGYNLVDLNTHINPTDNIEIFAQLRIKNQYGSFFGSGTNIDVRQLRASGIIKNKVKFSIGDIFLKQNRFTLYNYNEEFFEFGNDMFKSYRDIIHYENFYTDNRWRLQGIQSDFSLEFDRFIRTLEFDFFITRPKGSGQFTSNTYFPDLLLSGGSIHTKINKQFSYELNYVNLFEVPSSGTFNISVFNPVYHSALTYKYNVKNMKVEHRLQGGFSQRSWLHSELGTSNKDSSANLTRGMFFEYKNEISNIDSNFKFVLGVRYVDPNFRSPGAQTKRIDYISSNLPFVYPMYTNSYINRRFSTFDLISDERIYNQAISIDLMEFNPIFSNILPYGDATPNRVGLYLNTHHNTKDKSLESNLKSAFYKEVIGQGTSNKRDFIFLNGSLKFNVDELIKRDKKLSLLVSYRQELTKRKGDSISDVDLNSGLLNCFINAEIADKLFVQLSIKQFSTIGNEFISSRNEYGVIENYLSRNYNQKDYMYSSGISYEFRKNVYANIQYNWWGSDFSNVNIQGFDYQRLLFIFSVKL
jgi:hypothetical protein